MTTWLTAIVFNSTRMQLRKRQRQIHVSSDEPIDEEQEHTPSESLTAGQVPRRVSRIPTAYARERVVSNSRLLYARHSSCVPWMV